MKKRVLITGISGNMGQKAIPLLANQNTALIRLLMESSEKKRDRDLQKQGFELHYGDIRNYEQVKCAVLDCDMVIHMAALVSPKADSYPALTMEINVGGTANIINAIKEVGAADKTALVYIGSIAEYGNRTPPIHYIQCGDPIKISAFDHYAESKVKAERLVIESGLKYWVSLRQSGILHEKLFNTIGPIIFHQPLNTHIEWTNSDDCAALIYKLAATEVDETFWKQVYNISSGKDHRTTYFEFLDRMFYAAGLGDYTRLLSPEDFSLGNFHCGWFKDADRLDHYLHFRRTSFQRYWLSLKERIGRLRSLLAFIPHQIIRALYLKPIAYAEGAPGGWVHNNAMEHINAFLGSIENYKEIPKNWNAFPFQHNPKSIDLEQGFDFTKPNENLNYEDLHGALKFRNAQLIDNADLPFDLDKELHIQCSQNHIFTASPRLILRSGHFCPACDTNWQDYKKRAQSEPFFRQVFLPVALPSQGEEG